MRSCSILIALLLLSCAQTSVAPPVKGDEIPVTTVSDEARIHYFAGRENAELLHSEQARADYQAAIELDPDFAAAWLGLSQVATSREEAERCLDRAVALSDGVSEAERLHILATRASWDGKRDEARELWTRLVEDHYPNSAESNYRLAMAYWSFDDPAGIKYLERSVEIDPNYHVAWNMLGYMYGQYGRIDDAVEAHRRYVELVPEEPNTHDSYAETLLKAGRYEDSIAEYRNALAIDPEFLASRIGIGHNLLFLRRYDEAQAAYEDALARAQAPNDRWLSNTWLVTFGIYANRSDVSLAAAERGVDLGAALGDYEAATSVRDLARVYLWRGENAKARDTAGRAITRLGETASEPMRREVTQAVLRLLLEVDLADGDLPAATGRLEELRKAGGNAWQVQLTLFAEGIVALARDDAEEALGLLDRSFATDPRVLYYRGVACEKLRRMEEAAGHYDTIVRMNVPGLGHALVYAPARARLSVLRFR